MVTSVSSSVRIGSRVFAWNATIEEYQEWVLEDRMWKDGGVSNVLRCVEESESRRVTVDADTWRSVVVDENNGDWIPALYAGTDENGDEEWIPHSKFVDAMPKHVSLPTKVAPTSPADLSFEKIEGTGARIEVNSFLEGDVDGLVFHPIGDVQKWRAAFVARYDEAIVSVIVLHHYHPSTNGVEISITRLANHTVAPKNTSSWMIANARDWAERAGYSRLATYADITINDGTVYEAAGMKPVGEAELVQGKSWSDEATEEEEWKRQKWVSELSPETYAEKSEDWAVSTVVDERWTPGTDAPVSPDISLHLHNREIRQAGLPAFSKQQTQKGRAE
jgi:hypothetical protein